MSSSLFGKNLKYLRKEKKISQGNIAELVGKKQNTITTWESGKFEPDFESLRKIIDFLDVPLENMLYTDLEDAHLSRTSEIDRKRQDSTPKRTPNSTPNDQNDPFLIYKDAPKEVLINTIIDLKRNIAALERVGKVTDMLMNELRDQLAEYKQKNVEKHP